jgi:hypothetical protein
MKILNKESYSVFFILFFSISYGGFLSYLPNESISFAKTFLNEYNFNTNNEFYLKGILNSPISAQIYLPYIFLKLGANEEVLNRLWSSLTCFVSMMSIFYFAKVITKNNFLSILITLIFLSHKFLNTHFYSIHYPTSFFYFGQMGMYLTLLSISLLIVSRNNIAFSILIINFFCHSSWGVFNLAFFICYQFIKRFKIQFNLIHLIIILFFSLTTFLSYFDYKSNLDQEIKIKLENIENFKIQEFEKKLNKEDIFNKKSYLKSHNPFFGNNKNFKNVLYDTFQFIFFEILLIFLFLVVKGKYRKNFISLLKILIFTTFCILIFKFIIYESNFFLNFISNLSVKIPMILDRMIITRYLNLNTLIVLISPISVLLYLASKKNNIFLKYILIGYFFIFLASLILNAFVVSEHLPVIKIEKIIHNFLIYITFPILIIYFIFEKKLKKIKFSKSKQICIVYDKALIFFFILNLIYFPIIKSIKTYDFYSQIKEDFDLIASSENSEIITSSFIHGYIDVMYLTKSPIVVPMFSITKNQEANINIFCEDQIHSSFVDSNDYFKFIEKCFEERTKKEWLIYKRELNIDYVVARSYMELDLEKISSNNFVNIYVIKN